ncbi:hypothetical protein CAEBREN_08689 [Caenorhabditis brenneri]|uniref:Sdz-33 F-box domain-containing protein n=1 Tax=Caenorhabditis brenneri TaxID=135651 RepID=G0P6B9_CAEBE|nr:hypothetical protein CAEBREN_08689 [Caenorhabditis brenneri]
MSLSRPARFPMLRLPWLCIESVVRSWDIFDVIFFALISKRTRQIVKHLKIPLNEIKICLSEYKQIDLNSPFAWHFKKESEADSWYEEQYRDFSENYLVLQKDALPLYTKRMDRSLESYTDGKEGIYLQMAMELLKEVFKCTVEAVDINEDSIPESGDIGVKSTVNLLIDHSYGNAKGQKLSLMLENLEVTDTCTFWLNSTGQGFYVDPKRFKCKKLMFWPDSATWVTREILLQFEVPRLHFERCRFSEEDIAAFVTQWFHSDNRTFEHLYIELKDIQTFWEAFQDLNPIPFGGRARFVLSESFEYVDFFKGLKIVRSDGLVATIHSKSGSFLFYIWHVQPANT